MKYIQSFDTVNEAKRSAVHKAAKKGSYPAVIVVVQDGKVIHQEPVSTPDVAPATFNVMQEKYPKALLHLEDNTGKRLFSESAVTEAAKIETERYVRSHGKKPKGYGGWMFSYNRDGSDEWQIPNGMSWPDAQKWAKKKAKEDGEDYVYVMENESVDEAEDTIGGLNKMAHTDLERIADYADMIKDRMSQGQTLDAWMYSKISDSVKNLNSVHDTMDGNDGVNEAEKHEFNPNETAERLKRREKQNIERYRAAQDREDPFAVQYYQLRVSLDKMDLQRLKIQTQIHQLKQKYKK